MYNQNEYDDWTYGWKKECLMQQNNNKLMKSFLKVRIKIAYQIPSSSPKLGELRTRMSRERIAYAKKVIYVVMFSIMRTYRSSSVLMWLIFELDFLGHTSSTVNDRINLKEVIEMTESQAQR